MALTPTAVACGGDRRGDNNGDEESSSSSPNTASTRSNHRRRSHTTDEVIPPPGILQPNRPTNLYPVGSLLDRPQEMAGETSGANRVVLRADTFLTDLHRISTWYVALNMEDTSTPHRAPLLLAVTPITVLTHRPEQVVIQESPARHPPNTHMTTASVRMDLEARTRVTVCSVPRAIYGTAPRWFREELGRSANALVVERNGNNNNNNNNNNNRGLETVDDNRLSVDLLHLRWSQGLSRRVNANALIYVALEDVFGLRRPRTWMTTEQA